MPSNPPENKLYSDPQNATLWRDISRLYEEFCGEKEELYEERSRVFVRILGDVSLRLDQMECSNCQQLGLENVAEDEGTDLRCPNCGWSPVTIEGEANQ
jgi:hypothetical protein